MQEWKVFEVFSHFGLERQRLAASFIFVTHGEEELKWLVQVYLLLPLLRRGELTVEDLHIVPGVYLEAIALAITLIQRFLNSARIILDQPSVLHQFNRTWFYLGGSCLGPVVHDCNLLVRSCVSDSDGACDRVKVARNVLFCVFDHVEIRSEVQNSLLHFQTVGVSPESLVRFEAVEHFPNYHHVFALVIEVHWDLIQKHVEF